MNYRDRFSAMLRHEKVDRPPFDLDGTPMSRIMDRRMYSELAEILHLDANSPKEAILKALDIDFRCVGHMPSPVSTLRRNISDTRYIDIWGIERTHVGNDWQITSSPLKNATLDDLNAFPWPQVATVDPREIQAIRDEAKRLYEETDYVVCAEHPVYGVMELGCWMCGFEDFLLKIALDPDFVMAFFDKFYAYQRDMIDLYYGAIGQYIHVTTSGDDFGTQNGTFISPDMFSEFIAPYYDRRISLTKQYTNAAFFHHTCGSVYRIIPRMIDSGVEILNPIQPRSKDMEPERLKGEFGDRLCFWGGIDTQYVLPSHSAELVRRHVNEVLDVFGTDGGYVFAPAHCLQKDVPAENIVAMYRAAFEHYGL